MTAPGIALFIGLQENSGGTPQLLLPTLAPKAEMWLHVGMSISTPHLPPVGLVADLSKEDRDTLSSYGSFHLANPGEVLIPQGQSHGKLFFIISGLFHARKNDGNRDVLLGTIRPGEWVGEIDLFDPASAICSVVAMELSQYWVITRADLEDFINNYPPTGIQILISIASNLSRRCRSVSDQLAEQTRMAATMNTFLR